MSQEQEETEDENNPPGSLEPELEPESEPGAESEQNGRPGPGSEGANNEFEFYFQFTKPLVLYLPSPDERAIAAAWVQKLESRPVSAEEKQLRLNYLKLLLFVLQRGHLTGIFRKQPPSGALQPFPQGFTMMDMGNLMIDQSEAPGSGGGDTRAVPYTIEISNDLREFVAAQEIPNFGVQMYYAWSADEPVYKWNLFNENNFPNYIIEKIKLLKETKSEEKGGILDKICKKKPCEIPLLERIPKTKVKSPEEIEQTQARSYQTYVGLVGRMGNPYKGVCDDDQDKYNKQEQRKCRGQRTKKGSSMPMPMVEALARAEELGAYYRPRGQTQGHVVCRCPPTFHLPNCEVRRAPVERWQTPNVASNASGLTTTAYMRGERPEQVEDCAEMPAPDSPVQESPYVPRMRPTSRESERLTYRGPLTKKPVNMFVPKKSKPQSLKSEDVSKKSEAITSKKGGPPSKPSTGKCFCSSQQCSCPCPRGPPPKGKRQVQPTSQPISQPTSQPPCQPTSQPTQQPTSQPTSAGQPNVPEQGWCPPQQPSYGQLESSAPLPEWAKRGLIQQRLLNPVTGEFLPPKYCYPPNQGPRPSRRRWNIIPPEQRPPPCLPRDPSPCVPSVPSQQMNRREDKIPATPGPSTAPTSQREEIYPTVAKPTQKSLPGQSGTQRPGPFAVGTGGRLADMADILAEIKQKTEAHKIKCKPVATRMPVENDVRTDRIPVTPEQSPPQAQLPCEPIPHCSTQTTTKTVPVHQPTATASKYGGATFTRQTRRPDYWDMMERRRRGQRIAKDLFGGKEAFSKGTLEGIEPLGEDGECISESDDDFIDSSSSLECIDDQDRTLTPHFVPDTPEQDTSFSQPTLIQDNLIQNQPRTQRYYTSTPKETFPADISSILHCSTGPSPGTLPPGQTNRREQITPDFPYEPFPPPPGATYCGTPDPRAEARRSPIQNYASDAIDNDVTLIQDNRNQRGPRFFASTPKDSVFPADLSPILNCSPLAEPYSSNASSPYNTTPSTLPVECLTLQAGSPTLQAGSPTLQAGSPTLQAGSPTLQAGSPTLQAVSPTLQPLTPSTLQASYPPRRGQQCADFPFEPMPPSPGGTYYGTPDPRQNQECVPMDIYQQRTPVQYSPRSSPNECIPNNEAPPYYSLPSPVCSPELESSFPSGAFSSTLTPGTPVQVGASDVRSRRNQERRNRSASRGTPRRENIWAATQGEECENETPRRDNTWLTMQGELLTESERAAYRRRDNTWATFHGDLLTDNDRSRRDDNTWATMHGEICDEDW